MFLMKPHYHSVGLLELHNCHLNGREIIIKCFIGTIEINMVSDSSSLSEKQMNTDRETLTSGLIRESASP